MPCLYRPGGIPTAPAALPAANCLILFSTSAKVGCWSSVLLISHCGISSSIEESKSEGWFRTSSKCSTHLRYRNLKWKDIKFSWHFLKKSFNSKFFWLQIILKIHFYICLMIYQTLGFLSLMNKKTQTQKLGSFLSSGEKYAFKTQ